MRPSRCCKKITRIVFTVLNMVFFSIGTMILSVGVYLTVTNTSLSFVTGNSFLSGTVLLAVSGIITVIVAILGIFGSLLSNRWLLTVYLLLMSGVVVLEFTLGILGFVYSSNLTEHVNDSMLSAIQQYRADNASDKNQEAQEFIDFFQESFSCCGSDGPDDWLDTAFMNSSSSSPVPTTCHCNSTNNNSSCKATFKQYPKLNVWNKGCSSALINLLKEYSIAIAVVGILFAGFQIVGVVLGISICISIAYTRKSEDLIAPL